MTGFSTTPLRARQLRARQLIAVFSTLLTLVAGGCTSVSPLRTDAQRSCDLFFSELDQSIRENHARDNQNFPIAGHRWLRSNRYLASFANEANIDPEWLLDQMAALARNDYQIEWIRAGRSAAELTQTTRRIEQCQTTLRNSLPEDFLDQITPREEYRTLQRVFGLYPLTGIGVMAGIRSLHQEVAQTFATPLDDLPVTGTLMRWELADENTALDSRFAMHAPVIEVDVAGDDDMIGVPKRDQHNGLNFQADQPVLFVHTARTRFEGRSLTQLVYVFWFPSRTPEGAIDLLAGTLDGLTWRVTLDEDGTPLIYDVMHNCGCYHMFFPSERLTRRGGEPDGEPPIIPASVTSQSGEGRIHLRLAAGNHYVQRVWRGPSKAPHRRFTLRPYDDLRRGGLFPADGIIAESRRGEWLTLWPMGVPAPGAMRQWGRHATAFIGRRYFDEPFLFERYFSSHTHSEAPL